MICETKVNDSFCLANILINIFSKPYRLACNLLGGGFLLYVREDIQAILLEVERKPTESFYVEINLCNDKQLINSSNSDFNIEMEEQQTKAFCNNCGLKGL